MTTRDNRGKILLFFDQDGNWHLCRQVREYISIFIIIDNFKSSGFDKGTGEKSGKFQFDCDGCISFTRRSIDINSFSFSLYNLPFYTVFHSRAIANITEANFIIQITEI